MKLLNNYITEKLKINSKSKINTKDLDTWTINDAEDGDIIEKTSFNNTKIYFIYKCLNIGKKYSSADENAIVYHAIWLPYKKNIDIKIDTGVGTIDEYDSDNIYHLASEEIWEKFYKDINKQGYKWDNIKKEIVKL